MVHAKGLVTDGRIFNVGTCNFESWGYHRFYEINVCYWSDAVAAQANERFFDPAAEVSRPGRVDTALLARARNAVFYAASPLL
jgi:phosphatidylserine/phosphatidylglycerophosphate/cardiolipin synthase-like enzyme